MITLSHTQYITYLILAICFVVVVVPVLGLFTYNHWNKLSCLYKTFFTLLIVLILIINGYVIYKWLLSYVYAGDDSYTINKAQILIRQSARYAHAARQDKDLIIALLHANYGSGYLFAAKDIFPESELIKLFGSYNKYKEFEAGIITIQDNVNKLAIKTCPNLISKLDVITSLIN